MTEHTADVVEITELIPHPNADTLSLVRVGDFQVIVKTDDWKCGDLGIYIEPDTVVPETKEFEFLGKHRRIKARKMRGEWSVGLLIPSPHGAEIGDDYFEKLGLIHYEPQIHGHFTTGGDNITPPKIFAPKYDVLNFRKYSGLFRDSEEVILTEKIHGTSARFVCIDDEIYCSSRRFWKKETVNDLWWKVLKRYMVLEAWLRHHQDLVVYAEIFGQVQNLKYGAKSDQILFAAFDILRGDQWLDFDEAREIGASLPWVPLVHRGAFNKDKILELAEGDSRWPGASHYLEGVVVKPVYERTDRHIGRVQLKVVGNRYLSRS